MYSSGERAVAEGRDGTVVGVKRSFGSSTEHVIEFDADGRGKAAVQPATERVLLQKAPGSKGARFHVLQPKTPEEVAARVRRRSSLQSAFEEDGDEQQQQQQQQQQPQQPQQQQPQQPQQPR